MGTQTAVQWSKGQWREPKIGVKVHAHLMAMSYYPKNEGSDERRKATSVRLRLASDERVKFLAALWNALDKARGMERPRKWKAASVIERLVDVGLDGFGEQIGGWPEDKDERAEMLRRAGEVVDKLK